MTYKWATPVQCPNCGSSAVRRREVVYKTGTSFYSGHSSAMGFSFGLTGKARPRVWIGNGTRSGKRQTIIAQQAKPSSFMPAIMTFMIALGFSNVSLETGTWILFAISALLFRTAFRDTMRYPKEWLCSKCGKKFVPKPADP